MSQRFAVIGNPIAHSLSPQIHRYFAEQVDIHLTYEKMSADAESFAAQVSYFFNQGGKGLNVTLPFKVQAFELAEVTTSRAQLAGAVNTLWMYDNILHADNTDGIGLMNDLLRYVDPKNRDILILGAGGAARGILGPLLDAKPASLTVANRTLAKADALKKTFPEITPSDLNQLEKEYDLIINASSARVHNESLSLPAICWQRKPFCYDLSYNQTENTMFVAEARQNGCDAKDGLGMLVEQAAQSFYIWHGILPETIPVLERLRGLD